MASTASALVSHILALSLWICLSRFWDGGLLCNLISLMDPRKVVDTQFFKLILVERVGVMASKLLTNWSEAEVLGSSLSSYQYFYTCNAPLT